MFTQFPLYVNLTLISSYVINLKKYYFNLKIINYIMQNYYYYFGHSQKNLFIIIIIIIILRFLSFNFVNLIKKS